jgi:DNA-binding NtrC family response regulator
VFGFLPKPFEGKDLLAQVEQALKLSSTGAPPGEAEDWRAELVTASPQMESLLAQAKLVAQSDASVLIHGASGTGKELLARSIHKASRRRAAPFVAVNCAAIPEALLESELFGHRKGAFTGATHDRKGKFEAAHGGTIFLDEIGELPLSGQVKLLRVLESREIQRVGSDEPTAVDARIVAATNKNLRRLCDEGRFREDLFYRLSVIHVTLPPLRERRDEIPLLLEFFGDEAAEALKRRPLKLSPALREFLLGYAYPGNIRELRNLVYRISCLAGETAGLEHLPPDVRAAAPAGAPQAAAIAPAPKTASLVDAKRAASDEAERAFLEHGLRAVGGTGAELARRCDMNRSHLQVLLKKHGLRSRDFRGQRPAPGEARN